MALLREVKTWKITALVLAVLIVILLPVLNVTSQTKVKTGDQWSCTVCERVYDEDIKTVTVWKSEKSGYDIEEHFGLCGKCGHKPVKVTYGTEYTCPECDAVDESEVETKKVPYKNKDNYSISEKSKLCEACANRLIPVEVKVAYKCTKCDKQYKEETKTTEIAFKDKDTIATTETTSEGICPDCTPKAAPEPAPTPTEVTVHITNTGSKYHRAGCRYLSKSDIPVSLSSAKGRGLGP